MEQISTTIADYLINQSWQLVAVFALVAAACWGLRKRSAHWRYLLWLVVLAKCLVPGLIDIPLPVLKATAESEHATTSSHDMIPAEHLPMPAPLQRFMRKSDLRSGQCEQFPQCRQSRWF